LPGFILTAVILDEETHMDLPGVRVDSTTLSRTGTYTFPDILITPTTAGTWHLKARVIDSSTSAEYASKTFTITVVAE
jgi:hypothetical protein